MTVEIQKRKRVLFVDDERITTNTLAMIFSQHGYETKGVYSGEQALAALEGWQADLVVIDVLLPTMNGIDLAIRIQSQWPKSQILLFSGQTATDDLLESTTKNRNTFDILAKPIHPSELLKITGRLLGEPLDASTDER